MKNSILTTLLMIIMMAFIMTAGCDNDPKKVIDEDPDENGEVTIPAGEEGGECFPNGTCHEGLVCEDGICIDENKEDPDNGEKPDNGEEQEDGEEQDSEDPDGEDPDDSDDQPDIDEDEDDDDPYNDLYVHPLPTEPMFEGDFILTPKGEVYGWGDNSSGRLGHNKAVVPSTHTPVKVPDDVIGPVVHITASGGTLCVVNRKGEAYCFGDEIRSYDPDNFNLTRLDGHVPYKIVNSEVISAIYIYVARAPTSFVVLDSGAVQGWGFNRWGQLGNPEVTWVREFNYVDVDLPEGVRVRTIVGFEVSNNNTSSICALTEDKDVYCWGGYVRKPVKVVDNQSVLSRDRGWDNGVWVLRPPFKPGYIRNEKVNSSVSEPEGNYEFVYREADNEYGDLINFTHADNLYGNEIFSYENGFVTKQKLVHWLPAGSIVALGADRVILKKELGGYDVYHFLQDVSPFVWWSF